MHAYLSLTETVMQFRLLPFLSAIMRTVPSRWSCLLNLDLKNKAVLGLELRLQPSPQTTEIPEQLQAALTVIGTIQHKGNDKQTAKPKQKWPGNPTYRVFARTNIMYKDNPCQADNQRLILHLELCREKQKFGVKHYLKGLAEACIILFPIIYLPSDLIGHVSGCFSYSPQASPQALCTPSFTPEQMK